MHSNSLFCRVCGYKSDTPPWGEDGQTPLYDYCPCCGVEHGYQDATPVGARNFREEWIRAGAHWEDESVKPGDWSLEKQLTRVPVEFK